MSYLKNDLDLGVWITQKRLSRSSVELLKSRESDLSNDLDLGLWITQKRLSRSSVERLKSRGQISRMIETWAFGSHKNVLAEVV